ncbi:MAG: hypothetical protein KDD32_01310 [Bacteroidetes bacterium]|nr:hypothetical protein [Bacteroidota bacterium]
MKNFLLILVLAFTVLTSCNKDEVTLEPIFGSWRVQLNTLDDVQYLYFSDDNTFYMYRIKNGFKAIDQFELISITDTSFSFSGGGLMEINYTINDNQLILDGIFSDGDIVRDDSFNPNDWVTHLQATTSFQLPAGVSESDPCFFPDYAPGQDVFFYADGYGNDKLYLLSTTGTVLNSVNITTSCRTAEATPVGLAVSDNGSPKIFLMDETTGSIIDSSPDMGAWIEGIGYDNATGNFYCVSNNEQKVYKFVGATLAITEIGDISFGPSGLHFYNDHLYITSYNLIYEISLPAFTVVGTYAVDLENESLAGITRDRNNFWVATYNYESNKAYMRQISL